MKKLISSGAAFALTLAAAALPAASASAATYISKLEYAATSGGPSPAFGTVTLWEKDANNVQVTVQLNPGSYHVDTGGHYAFTFNLFDTIDSTVNIVSPIINPAFGYVGAAGNYQNAPFKQTAGNWGNAISYAGNGNSNNVAGPLVFNVYNAGGITFAGLGATFDLNGKLLTTGTGNHFVSNSGGYWFAADIFDGAITSGAATHVVAARDAMIERVQTAVPEPATWALMILGFGSVGAVLRSRRRLTPA